MPDELVIAVLSDLHAHDMKGSEVPSTLSISGPDDQPALHPFAGLKKLINDHNLTAHMVLCPGDMADKANPAALSYVWRQLEIIKNQLKAEFLIATAGNHDMDSRYENTEFDAKGMLQSLVPMFPGLTEHLCDRYWARNYVIFDGPFWRLIVLNSSAYHGAGKDQGKEFQHGRISRRTVEAMKLELGKLPVKPLNILLSHHHLVRDTLIAENDYSEMEGSDLLLAVLGGGDFGHWLIIHGHKHHPRLFNASGDQFAPTIFCAGSLCAYLPKLAGYARNQFYLLRLPVSQFGSLGVDVAGRITAWDWIHLRGWQPAGKQSGLPHNAGFGFQEPFITLVPRVVAAVTASPPYVNWSDLIQQIPQLNFMLPSTLQSLVRRLNDQKIQVLFDDNDEISQLSVVP